MLDSRSHRDRYLDYGGQGGIIETGTETLVNRGYHRDRYLDYGGQGFS